MNLPFFIEIQYIVFIGRYSRSIKLIGRNDELSDTRLLRRDVAANVFIFALVLWVVSASIGPFCGRQISADEGKKQFSSALSRLLVVSRATSARHSVKWPNLVTFPLDLDTLLLLVTLTKSEFFRNIKKFNEKCIDLQKNFHMYLSYLTELKYRITLKRYFISFKRRCSPPYHTKSYKLEK